MMNLEWYRLFVHTAKAGNLTKAAQELYITQPSVSYAIRQMEEELGVKLFVRKSKGVVLTAEGEALLRFAGQAFSLLQSGEKQIDSLKRMEAGEVRIGASDTLIKHVLLPHLDSFHAAYPDVRIRLSHGKTQELVRRLKEGAIDCGLFPLLTATRNDPELSTTELLDIQDIFVAAPTPVPFGNQPLTAAQLCEFPLLLLSPGSSSRLWVEQWFASQGVSVEPEMELGSIDLLTRFACLGYGAAFIPKRFIETELQQGTLVELPTAQPVPPRTIGVVIGKGRPLPIAADRFRLHMLSECL